MITPLINIQDVRDLVGLSYNVEETDYNQYIITAQLKQLRELIGGDCTKGLEDRKCSNTLTDADKALLEFIKPYLVHYSYSMYVNPSTLHSTNEGVVKFSGDNITQPTNTEKRNPKQFNEFTAESYGKLAIELIESNPDDYTCYDCSDCCETSKTGISIFDI